jgi:arylsulfatase A-like enzyme
MRKPARTLIVLLIGLVFTYRTDRHLAAQQNAAPQQRRNVIIFVADGLRYGSINEKDTPALWNVREHGVHFANSHSLFPTFTTVNAAAIATGHGVGDTGDFGNTLWIGYPVFEAGNFDLAAASPTPFIENDRILADLSGRYAGNYLHEKTLLEAGAASGYNTASIGKVGPVAIQHIEALAPSQRRFVPGNSTILVDDATGTAAGFPLPRAVIEELIKSDLSLDAPDRSNGYGPVSSNNNGYSGNGRQPGTLRPNLVQQQWFSDVTTQVILPMFKKDGGKPFLLLYWSRDPDGTQHNQGDSLGTLYPGVNGDSSKMGVQNADRNLRRILDWLDANPATKANTDIFITSDHGFATVSRMEIDRNGHLTQSESAKHAYLDAAGNIEIERGKLPPGFLAMDLAFDLRTNLFDPDRHSPDGIRSPYRQIKLQLPGLAPGLTAEVFEHPQSGNALLGDIVEKLDGSDAKLIVAANGGSDLLYVPSKDPATVREVVRLLSTYDYIGGIFVDDQYGPIPGALPLSTIGLVGATPLPRPAIVVAFKSFYLNPADLQTAIQIADTTSQEGQGMHGGLGRDSTWNSMAAIGPDFKSGYLDDAPVSNADIAPTIASILNLEMQPTGRLRGRVISEALKNGPAQVSFTSGHTASDPANGHRTILHFQEVPGERYIDRACFVTTETLEDPTQCP